MFGLGEGERAELGWGRADQRSESVDVSTFPDTILLPHHMFSAKKS